MIVRLSATTEQRLDVLGGKACGLVRLLGAGLNVPEAWVVPAGVSTDAGLRQRCLDEELGRWWGEVVEEFPGALWAVRSSAVAEDLDGASFAGVYQTVLGVDSAEALVQAVKTCWEALEDSRATSYLATVGMTAESGIALVLQRMVEADTAGVMLTENPLRPFDDQIVIDAAWGLGEAVVSGRTEPDNIVLDRLTGKVVATRIGAKLIETVWDAEIVERDVPVGKREVACLAPSDLASLHRLAVKVGSAIGARRDLEWAIERGRLYCLQDRPITGLPPRNPIGVWTRRFGDEYLADYMSPLGHGLLGQWVTGPNMNEIAELAGRPDVVAIEKLRRHDGYAFLNGDYVLALARALPPSSRDGQLTSWFDETFAERLRAVPFEPRLLLQQLLAPYKDKGRGALKANLTALSRHCVEVEKLLQPKLAQDYSLLGSEEWHRQYAEADALGQDHFRVIRWGMGHHLPLLHASLGTLLRRWVAGGADDLEQVLISGLPGTMTAAINRDVWDLNLLARSEPEVLAVLRSDSSYATARTKTGASAFWPAFDAFLNRHGHRSSAREVSAVRWHEQPDVVLGLVRAQVRSEEPGAGPAQFELSAESRRLRMERDVLAQVGRGPAGAVRRRVLTYLLRQVQAFTVYRENQRYYLDYITDHLRQLLLEQGRRFQERGVLADPEDVFLLSPETFWVLVEGGETAARMAEAVAEVDAARAHREVHAHRLPAAYLFDGLPTDGKVEAKITTDDGSLVGFGASSGQVRGTVRTVSSLTDLASVEQGDILVASNIDPGWTSVFPLLSGLVTETGGMLCHGAILAREYGIPTVTSLDGALGLLPTGTAVLVDGTAGTVRVLAAN